MTPPRREVAVGAIVVHDGCLLLVRRGRGAATGKWAPPGGRVEFGETLRAAVVREVREETGIAVTRRRAAGWVERTGIDPEPYHYVILDFFATPMATRRSSPATTRPTRAGFRSPMSLRSTSSTASSTS